MPPKSLMLTGILHYPQTLCSRNRNLRYNFYRQEIFKLTFCLTSVFFFSYLGECIKYAGERAGIFCRDQNTFWSFIFGHLLFSYYFLPFANFIFSDSFENVKLT